MNKIFPLKTSALRIRTAWLLAVLCWLGFGTSTKAQNITSYVFTASSGTFTPIVGGTSVATTTSAADFLDDTKTSVSIPIGFSFTFNGVAYTSVKATSDGFVSFNASATSTLTNNLSTTAASRRPLLAPLWDDLDGASGSGSASYKTEGTAGSQIFTIEYLNWQWNWNATGATMSFQVKLYEGSNKIEFIYRQESGAVNLGSASIGIAGAATGAGNFLSLNNTTASPTASSTTETTSISTKPATGQIYTFAPPVPSPIDVEFTSLANPLTVGCYGATQNVSGNFKNVGTAVLDFATTPMNVTVNVTGAVTQTLNATINTGTLAIGASAVYSIGTLNMTTTGTYNFAGSCSITGEPNTVDNVMPNASRALTAPSTLPQNMNFTGFTGSNLTTVFPNWVESTGSSLPTGTTSSWSNATGLGLAGNITARVNLFGNTKNEWIVGAKVSATTNTRLKFKVAVTDAFSTTAGDVMGSDDKLRIMVSADCGASWTEVAQYGSSNNFTTTLAEQLVNLSAYAGQNVIVAFLAAEGSVDDTQDYDLHIDDVELFDLSSVDIQAVSLGVFSTGVCPNNAQPINVTIRNVGSATVDFATNNATITVNVTGTVTQTLNVVLNTGTLAVNATQTFLVGNLNMSANGTYTFNATGTAVGDGNTTNDAMPSLARNINATTPVAIPQSVNFTGFTGTNLTTVFPNWSEGVGTLAPTGTTSEWTSQTGLGVAGNITARINLYTTSRNEWIIGPKITPTATTGLKFKVAVTGWNSTTTSSTMGSDDAVSVMVSNNCGTTWTSLAQITAANNLTTTLTEQVIYLNAYAGQDIIIAFKATDGPVDDSNDYDFHIDDISFDALPTIDMQATALATPMPSGCYTATEQVSVTIKNLGALPINFATDNTTVTVNVTGAVTQTLNVTLNSGSLATGATQNVVVGALDMTTVGTYTFNASVSVVGDANTANNAMSATSRVVTPISTLPQSLNFTGFTGSNLTAVFPNWSEGVGALAPTGTASEWTSQTGLGVAGNITARINLYTTSRNEWIVGPKVLATANTTLKFKVAVTNWNSTTVADAMGADDAVNVMISTNCGASWTSIKQFTASDNLTIALTEQSLSLATYAGQSVLVAFRATDGPIDNNEDYDFHIDDVEVFELMPTDIETVGLALPLATGCYTATQPISITIKNNGSTTIDFAANPSTITTNVTGTATATLTAIVNTGTLVAGASLNVAMVTPAVLNMSASGTYTFNASATTVGDVNSNNNAMPTATRVVTPLATIPQNVDFTGFTGANLTTIFPNWIEATGETTPTGTTSGWGSFTNGAASSNLGAEGNVMARINYYSFNQGNNWFVGPKFVATATTELKFSTATTPWPDATGSATIGDDDGIRVFVSTDCGATWTAVASFLGTAMFTETLTEKSVPLATYAGQQVIVALQGTTGAVVDADPDYYLYLDDIRIIAPVALDLQPIALVTPNQPSCYTSTQNVTVKIRNNGTSPVNLATTPVTVTTNVSGATTATLTATVNTGTIGANGGVLDVPMTGTLNMSAFGSYVFGVSTSVTGDGNTPNDTDANLATRVNIAPVALPQNVNFTGFNGDNITTLFPNWYEAIGETSPIPAANFVGWSSFTNTVASPNLGADGNVLARINYYSFSQGQNWFVGSKFVATATSTIKFSTAATQWNTATNAVTIGDDDGVQVMVSTDCGLTWTVASSFLGNANINNTLTEKTFSLGAYNGQQIIVAVRGTTGATVDADPDYWLWLDNIRVYDAAPIDMTALELVSPVNAGCYGANQTVTVKVKNLGALPMNFATNPTTVTVNVTGAVTQTLTTTLNTGTLAVDATQDVVVSSTFGMTAFGVYTFNANTNVTVGVDGDATNNAMLATTRNRVAPLTIPLPVANFTGYTDVEDNLDPTATNLTTIHPGWAEGQGTTTPTGTTSLWKSRTGLGSGTNTTTAFNFWSVRSAWLMTPKFTATPNGEIVYKTAITGWNNFNAYALGMDNDDVLDVLVSTDCGVTWTVVKSYNQTNTNTLTNVLVEDFVNLSAYNGQDVIVAFRASSTASGNDYDFHLDDIAIKNCVPPSITTQPSALAAICAGTPTSSYTVAAAGDGLAYQWQADTGSGFTNVTDGINYSGATTITLNILNAPATFNAYKYRVVVTGRCGSINSSENTLTVNTTPVITTEAQNKTACEGTNTSMTVDGTSFVAPTFKWQMRTSPTGAFADLVADAVHTNTTTATLNFTNVPFSHNGYQYRCVINNTCGNTFSSPATLTVTRKPIITVQPVSQSGCANENYTFSVTATSDAGNLAYQWQEDEGEGAGFVNLANDATFSGVATATLTITNIGSIFDGDKYRCIVTNDCGSTNTDGLAMYNWVDTQAPVFAAYNNITFNASAGNTANCEQAVTFATPTATDNCANTPFTITRTAGLASGSNFPVGVTNMTYTATDAKNNVATLNFTITVVDDVNPALVGCPANITVNNTVGLNSAIVNYIAPTATDNCAGVTVARTTGLASGSTFPLGITTITHEASDVAGNKVSCTFTVTVNFVNAAPTFTATNPATVLEDAGAQSIANWAIGNDNDEAVQTLTYEVDQIQTSALFSVAPAISANGTLTYTPAPDANGSSTFRVRLKDSGGVANGGVDVSAYQTFTINVTAVNDKPTIGVPTYNLEQVAGTDLAVEVSGITAGGGTDEANQTFSITNIVAITGANVVELPALPITITAGKANFNIKLVAAGEAQIRLTVRDNGGVLNGGVDTEERVFTIKAISQEQVFVPEMFSPNNDKDNDFLRVKAAKGIVQTIKLEVFDAQGNRVFYSDLVDRVVDTGWDGNNENGKPQPQGNYTWRLSGKFKDGRDIKATDGKNNNINRGNVFLFRGSN